MTSAAALDAIADDPLEGTAYRFVAHLGEGGMGEVVEAEHIGLGHRVVVKLLRANDFARLDYRERMRVEAQTCARIRHDNLVQVTDIGDTADGRTFLVMELLHGRTLRDEVKARGHLPVAFAIELIRQVLAGLSAVHEAGIVHRDIKPDNLFLCEERDGARRVKVLDFGIAKIVDAARDPRTPLPLLIPTAEGVTVGTPRYFSPEQARGDKDIDARSDIYAAGLVLWTLVTGQEPFHDRNALMELMRAHATELLPPPSSVASQPIPPELERALAKALAKRREDRFESAAAFRDELGRVAEMFTRPAPELFLRRVWAATEMIDPKAAAALRAGSIPSRRPTGTLELSPSANVTTVELAADVFTDVGAAPSGIATRVGPTGTVELVHQSGHAPSARSETIGATEASLSRPVLPWDQPAGRRLRVASIAAMGAASGGILIALVLRVLGVW